MLGTTTKEFQNVYLTLWLKIINKNLSLDFMPKGDPYNWNKMRLLIGGPQSDVENKGHGRLWWGGTVRTFTAKKMYKLSREMRDQERGNMKSGGAILRKKKKWAECSKRLQTWQQVKRKQKQNLTVLFKTARHWKNH